MKMFSNLLLSHGYFCASHPWEIIVTTFTITICSLSMAIYMGSDKICDWNYKCPELDEKSSDIIILTFTKCVAIFYIYLQFKKLRKLGSKYILGLAGLFTIFSSFVISATAINYLNIDLAFIKESIPFFLLLIDLSKASTLGKFSLNYSSYEHKPIHNNKDDKDANAQYINYQTQLAKDSIAKGMAILGPSFTLDTLVEIMVVGIGTMSGIKTLEMACLFGCISIVANYFIFMTFYPACLSLVLEMSVTNLYRTENKKGINDDYAKADHRSKISILNDPFTPSTISPLNNEESLHYKGRPLLDDSNFWRISFFSSPEESESSNYYNDPIPFETGDIPTRLGSTLTAEADDPSRDPSAGIKLLVSEGNGRRDRSLNPPIANNQSIISNSNILIGNPVLQRIKIIMSLGLLVVHIHSRLMVEKTGKYMQFATSINNGSPIGPDAASLLAPQNPLWLFWITRLFDLKLQDWITIMFGLLTTLHYLYYDSIPRSEAQRQPPKPKERDPNPKHHCGSLEKSDYDYDLDLDEAGAGAKLTLEEKGGGKDCLEEVSDNVNEPLTFSIDCLEDGALIEDKETQTDFFLQLHPSAQAISDEQCDDKLVQLLLDKKIASHTLDIHTGGDCLQSVRVRRKALNALLKTNHSRAQAFHGKETADLLSGLPFAAYTDYGLVNGACCENVIGYLPLPLGFAGPLILDGKPYYLPMATTEGCLVASTNRGCRAIEQSEKGVVSSVYNNGMTRGPVIRLPSSQRAVQVKRWLERAENFEAVKLEFEATSRFLSLTSIQSTVAGRLLYLRFRALTGDAMGMNMTSKACDAALKYMATVHTDMDILSLSGNYCTDKKVAAINWIEGRGKSVVCEVIIPRNTIIRTLKTTVGAMVDLNTNKNLIGSAMAGSIGGFNAHAANIVASMFIATGQDPAQVVTSANCITIMEYAGSDNQDLRISCTMPSLETGTIGGGTILSAQKSCLKMLGVDGPNAGNPGENSARLATIICGAVLAGELSLMAALSAGHLVNSHLKYNRSQKNCASS